MNKNKSLIVAVLALSLVWTGCNQANKVVQETKTAPTGPVELKIKWPPGRHAVQVLDLKQTSEVTVPGMPSALKQEMTMGQTYGLTALKEGAGGKRELEMEMLANRMALKSGAQSLFDFDSASKVPGNTNPMAVAFGKLIGGKLRLVLNASNRVESVEGAEEFESRLAVSGATDPSGVLKTMFKAEYFKQMMDQGRNLPDKPVQAGDTWPVQTEIDMGPLGTLVMDYTYTFENWESRNGRYCARIAVDGTTKTKPGQTPNAQGMMITIQDGKSSGETWFDLDMGLFVDTTLDQEMKANITVPNPAAGNKPGAPKNLNITSLMSQILSLKLELK